MLFDSLALSLFLRGDRPNLVTDKVFLGHACNKLLIGLAKYIFNGSTERGG